MAHIKRQHTYVHHGQIRRGDLDGIENYQSNRVYLRKAGILTPHFGEKITVSD